MKLGIAGAGKIVGELFNFIHDIDGITLEAIATRPESIEKVKKIAEEQGIKKYYSCFDELIADEDIEVLYIGTNNHLHYEMCIKALNAGKHIICEKPFTTNVEEFKEVVALAKEKNLLLLEAITTQYLPNYLKVKELMPKIGKISVVTANYSQYSTRYDDFRAGNILPVFDYKMSGGALMDINIYNVHFVAGLFGRPEKVTYNANIEQKIDVSGIASLSYDGMKADLIGAKDCGAPISTCLQGNDGYIHITTPAGVIDEVTLVLNDGTKEVYDLNDGKHRMYHEFVAFEEIFRNKDYKKAEEMIEISMIAMEILTDARKDAGIVFPADEAFQA